MTNPDFSVVIPVYNSSQIVGETIDRTIAFFESRGWSHELILVNDRSPDASWQVLRESFYRHPQVTAINLLRNYGQHTAVYCGLQYSRGQQIVTLDDDLQYAPEEILRLIEQGHQGNDAVFGRWRRKRHSLTRRLGSRLVNAINTRVFHKPPGLVLTSFRLLDRSVVDRMLCHRTAYPYINGLAVLNAERPCNVQVDHQPRKSGASNYTLVKIVELMMRILFNYSAYPLRIVSLLGLAVAAVSFVLSGWIFVRAVLYGTKVPGWASVAVMLSFFNGVSLLLLGMIGEYVTRLLYQASNDRPYQVSEILRHGG